MFYSIAAPGGPRLVSGGWDGSIKIWDLVSGECVYTIENAHKKSVNALIGIDNQRLVSASSDGSIKVWDLST
jgi:WD40 repeat protein